MASLATAIVCAPAGPAWASETFGVESFASSIVSNEAGVLCDAGWLTPVRDDDDRLCSTMS